MPVNPRVIVATIAVLVVTPLFAVFVAPLLTLVPNGTAYAQEEDGPSIEITFNPEGTVIVGTEIEFTLTFSNLTDYNTDSRLKYGVNVVGNRNPDVTKCESGGAFAEKLSIGTISGGTATTTGTIASACPAGLSILTASLFDSNDAEIISTAKGFTVTSVKELDISNATTTNGSPPPVPTTPAGLWGEGVNRSYDDGSGSAGVTRFHVVDSSTKKVFVYDLPAYDRTTTPDRDERDQLIYVETYDLASTTNPWGIVVEGPATWVSDDHSGSDDKVFAYTRSGERVSNEEFDLDNANTEPRGMHFTGNLLVADDNADKIFAYRRWRGSITRDTGSDYPLHDDNTDITGIWASGHIMWVADHVDDKLYAYEMHPPPREHLPERDVNGITGNPAGIWSDYARMYVLDSVDKTINGYSLPKRNYSPHVVSGPTEVEYPENSTHAIGPFRAQDPEDRSVSWNLYPSGDHEYFYISGGYLSFKSLPNYEDPKDSDEDNVYTLILIVTSGNFAHTYFPVKVTVTDVLGEQPMFTDTSTTRTVAENTPAGENIGDPVEAVNPDDDPIHIYSMSGTYAASFDFSTSTGQIISKAALDYETKSSYSVRVSIRDGENEDQSTSRSIDDWIDVTIEVTDLDEGPEVNGPAYVDHPENDLQVAEYTASDPNSRQISWQPLSGDDAVKFSLSPTGALSFRSPPDHETPGDQDGNNDYELTITARGGTETGSLNVTVYVNDVNEAPTFSSGQTSRSVAENTASGQDIGAPVQADDPDEGDTLTYLLGGDDAYSFDIDSSTGQILTYADMDHETKDEYTVTVTARDQSNATSSITVSISVDDANDQPEFADTTTTRTVEENDANADVGAPVAATDQDGDTLTYELTGGDTSSFTISSTGQLTTVGALDSDDQDTYSVAVSVRDSKDAQGASDTAEDDSIQVTITVTDVNEPPLLTGPLTPEFAENGAGNVAIYTADDPERVSVDWSLSGDHADDMGISSGALYFNNPPDHEEQETYLVTVQASDGNSTSTLAVVITVTDVNEAPDFPSATANRSVEENSGANTAVGLPVAAERPRKRQSDLLAERDGCCVLHHRLERPDQNGLQSGRGGTGNVRRDR